MLVVVISSTTAVIASRYSAKSCCRSSSWFPERWGVTRCDHKGSVFLFTTGGNVLKGYDVGIGLWRGIGMKWCTLCIFFNSFKRQRIADCTETWWSWHTPWSNLRSSTVAGLVLDFSGTFQAIAKRKPTTLASLHMTNQKWISVMSPKSLLIATSDCLNTSEQAWRSSSERGIATASSFVKSPHRCTSTSTYHIHTNLSQCWYTSA